MRSSSSLRSRDVAVEQVKQTFHVSVSFSPSPDNFSASINSYSCRALFSPPYWTNGKSLRELMLFFFFFFFFSRFRHCEKCVELLFAPFQVLRKQSEAKERIVIVLSSALWERRMGTQFLRIPFSYGRMWICVCVCAIPEGRSAVALNQQPLELVTSRSPSSNEREEQLDKTVNKSFYSQNYERNDNDISFRLIHQTVVLMTLKWRRTRPSRVLLLFSSHRAMIDDESISSQKDLSTWLLQCIEISRLHYHVSEE